MNVTLREAVKKVLLDSREPLTPQQIRDRVKDAYPHLYMTEAHRAGIEKGNYQNFDHALLNPIYSMTLSSDDFVVDRSVKPMLVSLASEDSALAAPEENYEADIGIVYVLSTGTFTAHGQRIIKIGYTTQDLAARVAQLYTTSTPFQFETLHSWRTRNYVELEQALHKLLAPFRINQSREFFTDEALGFVEAIAKLHAEVQSMPNRALQGASPKLQK